MIANHELICRLKNVRHLLRYSNELNVVQHSKCLAFSVKDVLIGCINNQRDWSFVVTTTLDSDWNELFKPSLESVAVLKMRFRLMVLPDTWVGIDSRVHRVRLTFPNHLQR